jgi:hypothetical protein
LIESLFEMAYLSLSTDTSFARLSERTYENSL